MYDAIDKLFDICTLRHFLSLVHDGALVRGCGRDI